VVSSTIHYTAILQPNPPPLTGCVVLLAKKIPSRRTILGLDELEPRLVPAGFNDFSFTNVDGSLVRVHLSRPLLTNANESSIFTVDNQGLGQQLEEINLTSLRAAANGLSLTVAAVPGPLGGDGFVNVGFIDATGINLGALTIHGDLGAIDAGRQSRPATALTALTVQSMGEFNTSTQAGNGTLESDISGALGALTVASDLDGVFINVTGSIGTVSVGGSLVGATADNSGSIQASHTLGSVTIGGDILGGTGTSSGEVFAQTGVKRVTVGGNVVGGGGQGSGQIFSSGPVGTVTVGGNVVGGVGWNSGEIFSQAMLTAANVGGSVIGGSGDYSGQIVGANIGPVSLAGSLLGGGGQDAGQILAGADIGIVNIGGNVVGGAGYYTGQVTSLNGSIAAARVGGSIIGGSGVNSGQIDTDSFTGGGSIGPVAIVGNLVGGSGSGSGEIFAGAALAAVYVGNSIIAGSNNGAMTQSGAIRAGTSIGAITIGGSLIGTNASPVFITAVGQASLAPGARSDVAIASLSVAGKVQYADILAGYDENLNGVNGQASIGSVTVGKDWIASNVIAGASGNNDTTTVAASTNFGGTGSVALPPAFPNANLTAAIAIIGIGGAVLGTPASANNQDQFGFVAQEIAAFSVGEVAFKLKIGLGNDNLPVGDTGDVNLLEV